MEKVVYLIRRDKREDEELWVVEFLNNDLSVKGNTLKEAIENAERMEETLEKYAELMYSEDDSKEKTNDEIIKYELSHANKSNGPYCSLTRRVVESIGEFESKEDRGNTVFRRHLKILLDDIVQIDT